MDCPPETPLLAYRMADGRHPDFQRIAATEPLPVEWDRRLFDRSN